jgi:hypothetical protein
VAVGIAEAAAGVAGSASHRLNSGPDGYRPGKSASDSREVVRSGDQRGGEPDPHITRSRTSAAAMIMILRHLFPLSVDA